MIVDVSIIPMGQGTSLSTFVAKSVEIIRQSGLKYEFHAMGTNLEGSYDQIIGVVKQCSEAMFDLGAERVVTRMVMDDRRDKPGSIDQKKTSVLDKLS